MPSTISKPRNGDREEGDKPAKTAAEPRPMPSFVSTLRAEETDFPRGGGTSLTALEVKQTRDEGRREAEADTRAEVSCVSEVGADMTDGLVVKEHEEAKDADQ
jgi:rRNA biogenesis protein RRP5